MSPSSHVGRCEQTTANKPPLLTAGDITPEALRAWEMGCLQFFRQKGLAEEEQVGKVAWNLQDLRVQDWYSHDCERLNAMTFTDFMKEVRSYWLPSDWADSICQKMLSSTQGDKAFHVWAAEVQSQNVLLWGSPSYLPDDNLRFHLESHMHKDLLAEYRAGKVDAEQDLRQWIVAVRKLDEKRLDDLTQQKAVVAEAIRASRSFPASRSTSAGTTKASLDDKARSHVPRLTTEERKLLQDNAGCFKCRQFFQSHTLSTCTNDFPDAKGYKTLTAADVEATRIKKRAKPIAAVIEDEPIVKRARASVEEIVEPIAVVMPSAALGNGSESGDECVAPFSVPHFRWRCLLDGPNTEFSIPVDALIDNGSHLVLIDDALVKKLSVHVRPLKETIDVSVAMSAGGREKMSLSQYVQLSCVSEDSVFQSRSFRAIVASGLCTPLLLGGPFLYINRIVIDHELRTCVNKDIKKKCKLTAMASLTKSRRENVKSAWILETDYVCAQARG